MSTDALSQIEDRIQKPGYLLLLVVVLLLLIVGLVDLIDYVGRYPVLFDRYPIDYFVMLVVYTLFTIAWATLLLRPNDNHFLKRVLDTIQFHPLLAVAILLFFGVIWAVMLNMSREIEPVILSMPAVQFTVFALTLLAGATILFYKWGDPTRPQLWRKIVLALFALVLLVELLVQGLASVGLMPSLSSISEHEESYSPYSRIYQSEEGLGSGLANNYGRYAPDFKLLPGARRIAVLGDSFVEGRQVSKDETLGAVLQDEFAQAGMGVDQVEILPLGHPDFGPGIYLSNWMLFETINALEPDEAIVVFDVGSDFQTVDRGGTGYPYYTYSGRGTVQLDTQAFVRDLHGAEHDVYRGFEGFQPVLFLKSNFLTARVLWELASDTIKGARASAAEPAAGQQYDIPRANGFVFNERTNEDALRIAAAHFNMANEQLGRDGIPMSLVVIPAFTAEFYEQETWNTRFGDSDLLLPEIELRESARGLGIPFLGLGSYMEAQGMTPADVQDLYYGEGLGHFTPAGHAFAAEAIYQCFGEKTVSSNDGCDPG